MNLFQHLPRRALLLLLALSSGTSALAQNEPNLGYAYPAGVRQGTSREITLGGQYLDGVDAVIVSGNGVFAEVIEHRKPLNQRQINSLRQRARDLRDARNGKTVEGAEKVKEEVEEIMRVTGMTFQELLALGRKLRDPNRQPTPQIDEKVEVGIRADAYAAPGPRELRLVTDRGLSNPIWIHVGQYREYEEQEPNDTEPDRGVGNDLPVIINGQILPGDVDRFSFEALAGERLVVAASARELIPFLADAVPGWFQATMKLSNANGEELAFADDYRFHPDPVLFYEIPEAGSYTLEIHDSIYRGREDFVYRIALGELPLLTGTFPLGGPTGEIAEVELTGWNLPFEKMELDCTEKLPGEHTVTVRQGDSASNRVPFEVNDLPECLEIEPNQVAKEAHHLKLPMIVNGRIGESGDLDVFRFNARRNKEIMIEVRARRLGSPVDSLIILTNKKGKQIASNDDFEDAGEGLITHHADSVLRVKPPLSGQYYLILRDAQNQGGPEYGYRLRISERRPDFELRVVPATINVGAATSTTLTVHALRKDGFGGRIDLSLIDPPPGFSLSGGWVPAGEDQVRLTLSSPESPTEEPIRLRLRGVATIGKERVQHDAVPAEDRTQAFILHHLVPSSDMLVAVGANRRSKLPLRITSEKPIRIPAGGTAEVTLRGPQRLQGKGVSLQLNDAPEGLAVQELRFEGREAIIVLYADEELVEVGQQGNLILDVYVERPVRPKQGEKVTKTRRTMIGTLPAVSFEIVKP